MDNSFTGSRYQPSIYNKDTSPLRRSDLPERDTLYRGTAEKRYGGRDQRQVNEEDEYNRRREEEIRKQIQQKDDKIQNLSKASDYLRNRVDPQPMHYGQESAGYSSFGRSLPERDRSPYSIGNNALPVRDDHQVPPPHFKEHITNLQGDNSSLMRRLNLVLQELDRVQKEKDDLLDRLSMIEKDQHSLQRMLNGDDKVDKVNRYMQDDLLYERDRNMKLSAKVKEEETYKNEVLREIRAIEKDQENSSHQNQNIGGDLHKKVSMIQDLEKELFYTHEKIRQVQAQIDQTKRVERDESGDVHELTRLLNSLREERNDILSKLDNLTSKYDECVRDITLDRIEIEQHNRRHSKLVTAKLIFQQLSMMHVNKLRQGFFEMRSYCSFDSNCHSKLQSLAKIMTQVGTYKLKIGLTQWYSKSLNPIGTKHQGEQLAEKVYSDEVKLKMFCIWRQKYLERIQKYDNKNIAVRNLFQFTQEDSQVEVKRSFLIWKDCLQRFKMQKLKVQKLIWRLYFSKLNVAMNAWVNHSANLDSQVRLNLLSKKFSHKQYLTILFSNFKYQITEGKRKKHNRLFHVMKAWKDYINHKKYLMSASIQAMRFTEASETNILKACFDAMKQHKEQTKFEKVFTQLNDVELSSIDELNTYIDNFDVDNKFKVKNKACQCVRTMLSKQLSEYFNHWKQGSQDYQQKLKTTVKDKIIKVYMNIMRTTFKQWKMNKDQLKLNQHQLVIQDYQQSHNDAQEELLALSKDIDSRKQSKDCTQKKNLLKCVASYERRVIELAVGRWKDNVNMINTKEDGASTVIKRLRTRLLRQAFDLYVAGSKYKKKLQIEEERCQYLKQTLNQRRMRKVYLAWVQFKNTFQKQKGYWHRIYLRLETTMKERAIKKWQYRTQQIIQHELHAAQDQVVSSIDELNKHLGELSTAEAGQTQDIKSAKGRMMKQAQRVLANTFARYYYIGETRGFEKWKEFVSDQKRKEQIMKKMLNHWKKYQFNQVTSTLKNWIKNADIQEKREALKKEDLRLKDAEFQLSSQTKNYSQANDQITGQLSDITNLQQRYNTKLQKSIKLIVNNVDQKDYMSKKRFILQQWRDYVKREKHFILCVQNVIQKSLWMQGFKSIKQASREEQRSNQLSTVLNKFRLKFWKRTCGNAFSKWRSGTYAVVTEIIQELEQETQAVVESQDNKRVVIKDHNAVKSGKLIGKGQLKDYFNGWKNVSHHLKIQRVKDEQLRLSVAEMKIKQALQKWSSRKEATKVARLRLQKLRVKFEYIRKMLVFNAIRQMFNNSKNFMTRMSNLANIHDHQALKMGYNAIQSFVKAKNYVHNKKKEHASKDIYSILNGLLNRRMSTYYNDLKYRTNMKYKQNVTKMFTVIRNLNNKTRQYFILWKENASKKALHIEMNEEGPVREQVFEQRQLLENCKHFMKEEGYGDREIQEVLQGGAIDKKGLLLKGIKRMQHYNEEKYVVPKAFDQWKQYVQLRKLFRYWLNYTNRRAQYIKSDMASAFDRWKHYDSKQKEQYMKMNKRQLDQKTLENGENMEKLAEAVDQREQVMDHMSNQRDALLENYIKGQKIAMCLWRNNVRLMLHRSFSKWAHSNQATTNKSYEGQVKKNIDLIAAIKERLAQLERDNESMANENEELRQFSLDGYQIAKNVQVLAGEREKLSVDLADKAQTIKKLLDENEKLNSKLKFAQDEAHSLIKSTNTKYMGVSASTGLGFTSPNMRGNAF